MARRRYFGSAAKGFADGFLAVMKLGIEKQHYEALERHYEAMELAAAGRNRDPVGDAYLRGSRGFTEGGGGGGGGGAYKAGPQAEAHGREMADYLVKNYGLSPAGAAGVVGNAWQESSFASNFNPGGDKGTAAGMFQWRDAGAPRQTDARNWMAQNGKDPNAWQSHLDYAMHETQRDYPSLYNQLRTATDPNVATHNFFKIFERGDPNQANFANREGMAKAAFGGGEPTKQTETVVTGPGGKTITPRVETVSIKTPKGAKEADKPSSKATPAEGPVGPETAGGFRLPGGGSQTTNQPAASPALGPQQPSTGATAPPPGSAIPNRPSIGIPDEPGAGPGAGAAQPPPGYVPPYAARPESSGYPQRLVPVPPPTPPHTTTPLGLAAGEQPPYRPEDDPRATTPRPTPPHTTTPLGLAAGEQPPYRPEDDPRATTPRPTPPHTTTPLGLAAGEQPTPYRPEDDPSAGPIAGGEDPEIAARQKGQTSGGRQPDAPAPTSKDKPSPDATTVSAAQAPAAIPPAPGNSRFTVIDAPNSDPMARGSRPQMGALDLSSLWGPNPPVAQRAPQPVTPQSNMGTGDFRRNDVSAPDMSSLDDSSFGYRRGGPVRMRYARGGAVAFAAGGAAPYQPTMPSAADWMNPNFQGYGYLNPNSQYTGMAKSAESAAASFAPSGGRVPDGNPSMRQYLLGQAANYYGMANPTVLPPDPAPAPAPAPAAAAAPAIPPPPAPIVNPTIAKTDNSTPYTPSDATNGGTATGGYKLPSSVTPTNPGFGTANTGENNFTNTQNEGGTNYSVDAGGSLATGDDGKVSGFRHGGVTRRVTGYDDGGGVSAAPLGMPPGLGGGPAAPPPIYFNPATYSAAGAPVGKGPTTTSVPTYAAGAIPSLPMMRGGAVKRYAEGGAVDDEQPSYASSPMMGTGEEGTEDDAYIAAGAQQPQQSDFAPPNLDNVSGGRTGRPQQDQAQTQQPQPQQQPQQQGRDPNLPAWAPQINDGNGHPSRGLIGAISDGLHYLASALGLTGDQQGAMASNPQLQAVRTSFANGEGVPGAPTISPHDFNTLVSGINPNGSLSAGLAHIAGMESVYQYYNAHGEYQKASQAAASMMQTSVQLSMDYGDQAVQRYYNNDLNGAVHALTKAKEMIADGTLLDAKVNPDGKSVNVSGRDLSGRELWAKTVAPEAILGAAIHTANGSMAWHMYEAQAAKYDPQTAQIIKDRRDRQAQDDANDQIAKMGPQFGDPISQTPASAGGDTGGGTGGGTGGTGDNAPVVTPASTQPTQPPQPAQPAIPSAPFQPPPNNSPLLQQVQADQPTGNRGTSPNTAGTAATASPPVTADSRNGPAVPPGPAMPPGPTVANAANMPSPDASPVSSLQAEQAAYNKIVTQTMPKYFTPDGLPIVNGRPMLRPPVMDRVTLKSYAPKVEAAYQERWNQFNEAMRHNQTMMSEDVGSQRRDLTTLYTTEQAARSQAASDARQQRTIEQQNSMQAERERNQRDFERWKIDDAKANALTNPRNENDVRLAFSTVPNETGMVTGKEPTTYMAEALGLVSKDKTPDTDALNKALSKPEQNVIQQSIVNGYRFSPDMTAPVIADLVTNLVVNPKYIGHPKPIEPDKTYGVPRVSITVDRSDGTGGTFVLPKEDYDNLRAVAKARASQTTPTPPTVRPIPAGPAGTANPPPRGFGASAPPLIQTRPNLGGTGIPVVPSEQVPQEYREMFPELQQ